ncbi:MAG: adenosylcobinamide-GDP ribazoletransferase [Bryobacteraceae bacterium]
MIRDLRGALQFLTIVPAGKSDILPGRAAWCFPIVGAMLGLAAAGVYWLAGHVFPPSAAAVLALLLLVVATGGLHEDGLADVADAVRSHRSRERILAILHDSRIGAHGGVAIGLSLLARWVALAELQDYFLLALPVALALSRSVLVLLAYWSDPAGEGMGKAFRSALTCGAAVAVSVEALAISSLAGWRGALLLMAVNLSVVACARAYFHRRIGGVTGDCLGAACQVAETASLFVFLCGNCI